MVTDRLLIAGELRRPEGVRPRGSANSLAGWLDDKVPIGWLADLRDLIRRTPNLDWLAADEEAAELAGTRWRSRRLDYAPRRQRPLACARITAAKTDHHPAMLLLVRGTRCRLRTRSFPLVTTRLVLANARCLEMSIPCKGALSLWKVPSIVEARLNTTGN